MSERVLFRLGLVIASVAVLKGEVGTLSDIQASLVMEKQQYLIGEPIMLIFRMRNTGPAAILLSDSDPYGQCSAYHLVIDPKQSNREPASGPPCAPLFRIEVFECLSGGLNLVPGRDEEQRILLNRFRSFSEPGTYTIKATRRLSLVQDWGKPNQSTVEVSRTFTVTVTAPRFSADLQAAFEPYLEDLRTGSYRRRHEAAIAIALLPLPFLEPSLLEMLSSLDSRTEAIGGLRRLNTRTARDALFDLVRNGDGLTSDQEYALTALGEMKDGTYGPLLLAVREHSHQQKRKTQLLLAAARLDPTTAMPVIRALLESSQETDRAAAINALAATERPEVLPRLLQGLTDPSLRVREAAANSLVSLTRRSPTQDGLAWSGADPATDVDFWSSWLRTNPASPIHPIRECPQMAEQ